MQHDLDGVPRGIRLVAFAPVIANGIGEYGAVSVESSSGDGAMHRGVALETMLRVLIPSRGVSVHSLILYGSYIVRNKER